MLGTEMHRQWMALSGLAVARCSRVMSRSAQAWQCQAVISYAPVWFGTELQG